VRIEATVAALDPDLNVIAPVRQWSMSRDEEIAYARERGIPVKGGTETPPYSIDDNLWGRSSEGSEIEDLSEPPRDAVFQLVTRPEEAPDEAELVRVEFEGGCPVALDGERMELVQLLERAAELGRRHGVGIVDHIEDRIVGLKIRDVYEVPAAAIILTAHRDLEALVSTIHQNNFKRTLEDKWAYLCYAGLWYDPLRQDLDAYMDSANEVVTGEVTLKLYKGSVTPVARRSPYALYDRSLASFGESGAQFSQDSSPGFIELFTLQTRMARRVRAQHQQRHQPVSGPEGPSPEYLGENEGEER
jgi:argininosuccinate synthase